MQLHRDKWLRISVTKKTRLLTGEALALHVHINFGFCRTWLHVPPTATETEIYAAIIELMQDPKTKRDRKKRRQILDTCAARITHALITRTQ